MVEINKEIGAITEWDDTVGWGAIETLINFSFEDAMEDDAWGMTGAMWPVVIINGSLKIEGDTTSQDLPVGRPGFTDRTEARYVVVILGDLEVSGHLKVQQYNDLIVGGDLRAKSVRSHSGNIVVKGTMFAEEMVLFEENDEGGICYAEAIKTPLSVKFGSAFDIEPSVSGELAHFVLSDERMKTAAIASGFEIPDSQHGFGVIESCLLEGNAGRFLEAYVNAAS